MKKKIIIGIILIAIVLFAMIAAFIGRITVTGTICIIIVVRFIIPFIKCRRK